MWDDDWWMASDKAGVGGWRLGVEESPSKPPTPISQRLTPDPAEQVPFVMQPVPVALSPRLSSDQKAVYCLLRCYARQDAYCFPGQVRLAAQVPCSSRTLIKLLQALQQIGLITIERRGRNRPNRYWIEPLTPALLEALK